MTAKEYLSQAYKLDCEIRVRQAEIEAMRAALYGKGTKYDSIGGQPADNSLEKAICRVIDRERALNREISTLISKKEEIATVIRKVSNARLRELLIRRYLSFERWDRIAYCLAIDTRYAFKLHDKALDEVKKIIRNFK